MMLTTRTLSLITILLPGIAFAQASHDPEEWYLWTDDGARLYVTERGHAAATGDTVIVLHGGWGAEHPYLLEAVEPLADPYHFVLYDQRGSLRSPAPDSTITYERMVADLEALREELGLGQVVLLTHSMGTALAYLYLAEHPDRVGGLVFTGPVPPIARPEDAVTVGADTSRVRVAREAWRAGAESHVAAEIEEEGLDRDPLSSKERTYKWRIGFTGFNTYHVERWRQVKGGMAFYNPSVVQALQANASENWSDLLARLRAPLEAYGGPVRVALVTSTSPTPAHTCGPTS